MFVLSTISAVALCGQLLAGISIRIDPSYPKIAAAMSLKDHDHEIVFLGDSTVNQGVNPIAAVDKMSVSAYNLATPGAGFESNLLSLEHYLKYNAAPRLLVQGVYVNKPRTRHAWLSPHIYVSLAPELRSKARELYRHIGAPLDRSYRVFNGIRAYRHRGVLPHIAKYLVQGEDRIPRLVHGHLALGVRRRAPVPLPDPYDSGIRATALRPLLALAKDKQIPVLLVELPNTPGTSQRVRNRARVIEEITALVDEGLASDFVSFAGNASREIPLDHWVNWNHLNRFGAKRFSRAELSPLLREYIGEDSGVAEVEADIKWKDH